MSLKTINEIAEAAKESNSRTSIGYIIEFHESNFVIRLL